MSQAAYEDMAGRFLEDDVKIYCLRLATQKTSTSSTSDYTCNVVLEKRAAAANRHGRVLVVLETNVTIQHTEKHIVGFGRGVLGQSVKQTPPPGFSTRGTGVRVVSPGGECLGVIEKPKKLATLTLILSY